ncbi:MAG TPA: DUF5606 domain-containing protein [Daejeonella sp.]|nr:DUF5606 domain-containing protein [Daejeonella sp.]
MNLRGLVSVSGKPGLFKLIGQNKSGFILESLDGQKTKTVVNMSTSKMATLEDITVFGDDDDLKLVDIFEKIKSSEKVPDVKTADGTALRNFFREVAPGHDEDRVYASDMKKILNWYSVIKELPLFTEEAPEPLAEGSAIAETPGAVKKAEHAVSEKPKATKAPAKSATRVSQKAK